MEIGKIYKSIVTDAIVQCVEVEENSNFFKGLILNSGNSQIFRKGYVHDLTKSSYIEYTQDIKDPSIVCDVQIGGDHYKKLKIQPTEFIHANEIPFIEGNIIKYVIRHRDKNGIEDLKKARHYIDLLIQFEYENTKKF